jgi:hypothetical protein
VDGIEERGKERMRKRDVEGGGREIEGGRGHWKI